MSHDRMPRGGQYLGQGEEAIVAGIDRKRGPAPTQIERDWCAVGGALELKRRIERFWADHGRSVSCRVEHLAVAELPAPLPSKLNGSQLAVVRSDLKNGMPQRRIGAEEKRMST